ncbi:MAG: UDP-N-acetylmuramoyl-tripeptide--D-alanyl-D-alanine ligase [Thermoanaerobaculia bacterium]
MNFSLTRMAAALNVPPVADAALSGVAVDSRKVRPGDLFVALAGERVDGHDFAAQAVASGAAAVLGARVPAGLPGAIPVLVVPDPGKGLLRFAGEMKRESGFRLAAVAGSVGKTTTKEFATAILARRHTVEKTPGNQNSAIGFPMSVLNFPKTPEWMVGEMGMSAVGEVSRLSRTFEPDVAAITVIAAEHLEFLGSLDGVARANGEILDGLKPNGVFVINADDERIEGLATAWSGRALRFGHAAGADVTVEDVVLDENGSSLRLRTPSGSAKARLPVPGLHQVANYLAASAVALAAGASPEDCAAAAGALAAAPHRGEFRRHASGALLYDDAYNASPPSMRAALDTLKLLAGTRKIAVLGDMLELGPEERWWHRETGKYAVGRADRLVCVGKRAAAIGEGAIEAGFPSADVSAARDPDEAAALLETLLAPGDAVLFKASRGVGLDRAVAKLAGAGNRESGIGNRRRG